MEIYKSQYWSISYEKENAMIIPRWNENSFELTSDVYKFEMEKYTEMVEKYRPSKALIDTIKFGFTITPEIQEWTNKELFPRILASGVINVAIIMPDELITQLALEQVMEESQGVKFTTNYFSDESEAREWLTNK